MQNATVETFLSNWSKVEKNIVVIGERLLKTDKNAQKTITEYKNSVEKFGITILF